MEHEAGAQGRVKHGAMAWLSEVKRSLRIMSTMVPTMTGALQLEVPVGARVAVAYGAVGEGADAGAEGPVARSVGRDGAEVESIGIDIHGGIKERGGSKTWAETVWLPEAKPVGQSRVHVPSARTRVVCDSAPMVTVTVDPTGASVVPEIVGVVSPVEDPSAGVVMVITGASVSTVKMLVLESTLTLPAASVEVAFTVCGPSARATEGVKLQAPAPSAVVVPTAAPSR